MYEPMCAQIRVLEQSLCHLLRVFEWNPQWRAAAQGRETPNTGKGTLSKPRGDVWHASGPPKTHVGFRLAPSRHSNVLVCQPMDGCVVPWAWRLFPSQVPKVSNCLSLRSAQDCYTISFSFSRILTTSCLKQTRSCIMCSEQHRQKGL